MFPTAILWFGPTNCGRSGSYSFTWAVMTTEALVWWVLMRKRPRSREGVAGFGPSEHRRRVSVSPSPTRRSSTLITHSRITASSRTGALKTAREYGMLRGMPLLTGCFQHGGKGRGALGWSLSSAGLNKQVTVQEDSTSKNSKNHFGKVGEARVFWSVGIG
jgi:hypothetical protein